MAFDGSIHEIRPLPPDECDYDALDPGVREYVRFLRARGVETFESCQAGEGHCFIEPTVRFHGGKGEGMRALGLALTVDMPVSELRRRWSIEDGEPRGPWWELTFSRRADL